MLFDTFPSKICNDLDFQPNKRMSPLLRGALQAFWSSPFFFCPSEFTVLSSRWRVQLMYPLLIFVFLSACSYLIRLTCKIKMSKMSDFYIYVCICRYLCIHMYIYANLTYSHRHVLYVFPIYLSIYLSIYLCTYLSTYLSPLYLKILSFSSRKENLDTNTEGLIPWRER